MPRVATHPRPPLTKFERQALVFHRLRYGRFVPPRPVAPRPALEPWISQASPRPLPAPRRGCHHALVLPGCLK